MRVVTRRHRPARRSGRARAAHPGRRRDRARAAHARGRGRAAARAVRRARPSGAAPAAARAARRGARRAAATAPPDELLVEALAAPGRFATIDHRVGRAAERLAETLARSCATATARSKSCSGSPGTAAGSRAAGTTRRWAPGWPRPRRTATSTASWRCSRRRSASPSGVPTSRRAVFLADVLDAEVPEDVLAPRALSEAVLVTTPSATVGLEFDTVVVAGLQEGVWPNLRLRGSLLCAAGTGARRARRSTPPTIDERARSRRRAAHVRARRVPRAPPRGARRRRQRRRGGQPVPAMLGDRVRAGRPVWPAAALAARAWWGGCAASSTDPAATAADREAAASTSPRSPAQQVPGATPDDWHGLAPISTDARRCSPTSGCRSRPSRLETVEESPLDWFLETIAGSDPGMVANVGTIVHWAMEPATSPDPDELWAAVESRWGELLFESPWLAERQKRTMWRLHRGARRVPGRLRARRARRSSAAESGSTLEVGDAVRARLDRPGRAGRRRRGRHRRPQDRHAGPASRMSTTHPQLAAYQLAYAEDTLDEYLLAVRRSPRRRREAAVRQARATTARSTARRTSAARRRRSSRPSASACRSPATSGRRRIVPGHGRGRRHLRLARRSCGCTGCGRSAVTERDVGRHDRTIAARARACRRPPSSSAPSSRRPSTPRPRRRRRRQRQDRDDGRPGALAAGQRARASRAEMLGLTFTRKAAGELRARIRERIAPAARAPGSSATTTTRSRRPQSRPTTRTRTALPRQRDRRRARERRRGARRGGRLAARAHDGDPQRRPASARAGQEPRPA